MEYIVVCILVFVAGFATGIKYAAVIKTKAAAAETVASDVKKVI